MPSANSRFASEHLQNYRQVCFEEMIPMLWASTKLQHRRFTTSFPLWQHIQKSPMLVFYTIKVILNSLSVPSERVSSIHDPNLNLPRFRLVFNLFLDIIAALIGALINSMLSICHLRFSREMIRAVTPSTCRTRSPASGLRN